MTSRGVNSWTRRLQDDRRTAGLPRAAFQCPAHEKAAGRRRQLTAIHDEYPNGRHDFDDRVLDLIGGGVFGVRRFEGQRDEVLPGRVEAVR